MKKFSTKEAAKELGVCHQRILAKIKQGHFPNAHNCECGRSILIPEHDVTKQINERNLRNEKRTSSNNRMFIKHGVNRRK